MSNSLMESMWKSDRCWWLKFDIIFSQVRDLLKMVLQKLWKGLAFSQSFHLSVQAKITACKSFLSPARKILSTISTWLIMVSMIFLIKEGSK